MIKKAFNFLFWGGIAAFSAYNISNHFDSFEIASSQFQEEKYEEADIAISKYNAASHRTLKTVNGYILQSEISNQLDRFYVAKELATHALELSKENQDQKGICLSYNALEKSRLLIGELKDVEIPLVDCLNYFQTQHNDFDTLKTLNNLVHFYMLTNNNKKFLISFNDAEKIIDKKDALEYLMVDFYVDKMFYHMKRNENELASDAISKAMLLQKKHFSKQLNKLAYLQILSVSPIVGTKNLNALEFIHDLMNDKSLKFNISMKIHTLLVMSQIYKNLEDYDTAVQFDLKALELLNTFPIKEVHAIEAALVYKSLIQDYQRTGNTQLNKIKNESQETLKNFPEVQQFILN